MMEAFLICALATSPMSFSKPIHTAKVKATRDIIGSMAFIRYTDKKLKRQNINILIVAGDPDIVTILRTLGVQAFGVLTEDRPGATQWHAVGNSGHLPVREETFRAVYWLQKNAASEMMVQALVDVAGTIVPGGFLLFDMDLYPSWPRYLKMWEWEILPFRAGALHIYKKPFKGHEDSGNIFSFMRGKRNSQQRKLNTGFARSA